MTTKHSSLSIDSGICPPGVTNDWTVRHACTDMPQGIPTAIWHSLIMHRAAADILREFGSGSDEPATSQPSAQAFDLVEKAEQQFDAINQRFNNELSFLNNLHLLALKMHVQCLCFLDGVEQRRHAGILRAYQTSADFLSLLLSNEATYKILPSAPPIFGRIIFQAAVVILRVIHSSLGAALDYNLAQNLYNTAAFSMKHLSTRHNNQDLPLRGSDLLRRYWRAIEKSRNHSLGLRVKTRMGASIVYDCIYLFRNCGQQEGHIHIWDPETVPSLRSDSSPGNGEPAQRTSEGDAASQETGECYDFFSFNPNEDFNDLVMLDDIGFSSYFA